MTTDFGELEYGAIQGVSNQESSIDYEQFDFLSSHDEQTFFEPLPDVSHCFDEQLCGKNGKRAKPSGHDVGRQKNPRGADGHVVTCRQCGSGEHVKR